MTSTTHPHDPMVIKLTDFVKLDRRPSARRAVCHVGFCEVTVLPFEHRAIKEAFNTKVMNANTTTVHEADGDWKDFEP